MHEGRVWDLAGATKSRNNSILVGSAAHDNTGAITVLTKGEKEELRWVSQMRKRTVFLNGHTAPVNSFAFSPNSKLCATGSVDKTIRLWTCPRFVIT